MEHERRTITMRVRVPLYVCGVCGAEALATVQDARSWIPAIPPFRRPDDDSQLNTAGWSSPEGWWDWNLPTRGLTTCERCTARLAGGLVAMVERLRVMVTVASSPPAAALREFERRYDEALEAGDACPGCVSPGVHDDATCPFIRKHGRPLESR